jgi:hypothetical protein
MVELSITAHHESTHALDWRNDSVIRRRDFKLLAHRRVKDHAEAKEGVHNHRTALSRHALLLTPVFGRCSTRRMLQSRVHKRTDMTGRWVVASSRNSS